MKIKLSNFIESVGDGIHGTPIYDNEGDYFFINGNNLFDGEIYLEENALKINLKEFNKIKRPLSNKTLLLSINGSLGNVAYYNSEPVALGKSVAYINLKEEKYKDSVYYILNSPFFKKYMTLVAGGSTIKNFSPSQILDFTFDLKDNIDFEKIGKQLKIIDLKIKNNRKINKKLEEIIDLFYIQWFLQFNFPDKNGKPYEISNGKMIWNEKLKMKIPFDREAENLIENSLCHDIKSGISFFDKKNYLATVNVNCEKIIDGKFISYDNRESRANMEPRKNSIWFAKMKNTIKHITIPNNSEWFIDKYILSTGFQGLQCNELSLPYIHCIINSSWFEKYKDKLSHGATQQSINNEDLKNIVFPIPDDETLKKFNKIVYPILEKKFSLIKENQELESLRNFLLPLLMNGQVTVK